jgi:hypothetical protein
VTSGTGSILVALTHMGGHCTGTETVCAVHRNNGTVSFALGTDIDIRVLRGEMHAGAQQSPQPEASGEGTETVRKSTGKKKIKLNRAQLAERNIFANFAAYQLERPELIRLDNHMADRHYCLPSNKGSSSSSSAAHSVHDDGIYNCIVTDPPYGIRAGKTILSSPPSICHWADTRIGAKKSGKREEVAYSLSTEQRAGVLLCGLCFIAIKRSSSLAQIISPAHRIIR